MKGQDFIQAEMTAVEEALTTIINSDVELLFDASHHIVSSGGKRIRPRVTLLSYLAAGGTAPMTAVNLAAALEMVHTATLVHDDINDHSLLRRGKITVHARWGRTFALLAGDYLFTKVYELMAPYGDFYNVVMADACVKLVEGETLQAIAAKAGEMDRETYKKIISRKTASLFEAAARMGAKLAGGDDELVENLAIYGHNLGLTFQIVDDILDIIGDPETLGKPVGADVAQGRGVMMVQNGGKHGHEGQVATAVMPEDPLQKMMASLRESGAVEIARLQAIEMAERARAALVDVPTSAALTELHNLIDLVLERNQ
ncbi:MAG: polyprenyl synthetase family protein [Ardenticatenaceae bacterium]|nr:polyprenyl synthetase family protein [Ardenticatenaceae bacterium]